MRRKKIKLQNLDAEIRASSRDCPPIFRGVVAHVNGYTQPSLQDLHRLIVSHGGGFLQYLDNKTSATHIIASSLTPKKREEFRRYRIVKPAWVTQSIEAGRLLPWNEFRAVDEGQSQKVLKFGGGRITSENNSLRSGYKEQSSASWYNSQLRAPDPASTARSVHGADSHSGKSSAVSPIKQSESPGASSTPAVTGGENITEGSATPSRSQQAQNNSQEKSANTPSKQRTIFPADDADELESPHKDSSARIQVDPVLSNSAHKPLNLSGSQFVMPPRPEPKSTPTPVSDIRSKLAAQAKPRKSPVSSSPCPSRQARASPAQRSEPTGAGLPPEAQIDPETLAALPEDIRKEVMGYYGQHPSSPTPAASSSPAPVSSTPIPAPAAKSDDKRDKPQPKKESQPSIAGISTNKPLAKFGFISQSATPSTPSKQDAAPKPSSSHREVQPKSQDPSEIPPQPKADSSPEGPSFTSQRLSNLEDLKNAISAWYSTFTTDGPYGDDVESLCTYLRRVVAEEKDVEKAVSVVRWLMWLVEQTGQEAPPAPTDEDVVSWADAIKTMQQSVQGALEAKGLDAVNFE